MSSDNTSWYDSLVSQFKSVPDRLSSLANEYLDNEVSTAVAKIKQPEKVVVSTAQQKQLSSRTEISPTWKKVGIGATVAGVLIAVVKMAT